MIVAIIGSRDYADVDRVRTFVRSLPRGTVVVSGGARGVDRAAATEARSCGLLVIEHIPDWEAYGRRAGFLRNGLIVRDAAVVVAFWDGESRGTAHTMEIARGQGKPVVVDPETASDVPGL